MKLRTTTDSDLLVVTTWLDGEEATRLWGGPAIRFPHGLESLKEDIQFSRNDTVSLVDARAQLLGVGQLVETSPGQIHLARLIISPGRRGEGLGRTLCRRMIQRGIERFEARSFSLHVYRRNHAARSLYESLHFKPASTPASSEETLLMSLSINEIEPRD